ncbi:MAG: trypsin-like peptidase domain-containing protein, partial [Chloroflexi bacterium]|nr:trypsin-like peptidase domain-containing protein [Chloroflexota bacterium]
FGTCFLVAQNKLLTCAHVIKSAGGVDAQLFVRFSGTEDLLPVQLAANGWHPKLDIACLEVNNVPQTITPLLLSTADKSEDHPFRTIGFPNIGNYRGLVAEGTVYGLVKKGIRPMLQLDTKNVTTGFSGAPVFDTQQQCVVGMVVEVYNAKLTHKLRDAAFALPMSQIWQTIPELHPPQTKENPFFYGGRINDPTHFFGRSALLTKIKSSLTKRSNISLVGTPQIGKSSLLYYLYQTQSDWLPDVKVVFLDLQGVWDEKEFFEEALMKLGQTGDTHRQFKHAIRGLDLIFLLDEVERLAESDFSRRLRDLLRSLGQDKQFAMCISSQKSLIELFPPQDGMVSPFYNIFSERKVPPFTTTEARQFLAQRLAPTPIHFTQTEINHILSESNNHPAKLQQLAKELFDEKTA